MWGTSVWYKIPDRVSLLQHWPDLINTYCSFDDAAAAAAAAADDDDDDDDATVLYCLSVCVVHAAGPDGEYTSDVSTSVCALVCI